MHAPVLMLVTAFAASVAAAPLPITPIESPVEGLAVRDAEVALSQAQMDVLKRSIFERLEEIVPVKRDQIKRWTTTTESDKRALVDANNNAADKRALVDASAAADKRQQPEFDPDEFGTYNDKRAYVDTTTNAGDKRDDTYRGSENSNDKKRWRSGGENDKRQSNSQYQASSAGDKRQSNSQYQAGSAGDKRQSNSQYQAGSAGDKRQSNSQYQASSAGDKRQDGTYASGNYPANDKRADDSDACNARGTEVPGELEKRRCTEVPTSVE